ncbi:MAG: hypothetical protein CSA66_03440 [Proteobacteria bacterium]|nr:MAG: hypothetical protein CSA66_03440 [Pseudomonadota bacterium]
MAGPDQYFQAARERLAFLEAQRQTLQDARASYERDAARAEELLERSWRELAGYLLPEVHDALLVDLEARLSYPGLRPIRDEYADRITQARARRLELAQREEVLHTDILVAGVDDQLAEIAPSAEAFRRELDVWTCSRWFQVLEAAGWFRPDYAPGFFARIRDWRAVSLLLDDLEERDPDLAFDDPEALKGHYHRLQADSGAVFDLEARLTARRAEIEALAREHEALTEAPANLRQQMYVALAAALRDHLEACPVELRFELAHDDPHLLTFFKKISGLDKKTTYLRELSITRIGRRIDELTRQLNKLQRKLQKRSVKHMRGRFYGVSQAELDGLRDLKADKWARRHLKLDKLRRRLAEFDRWESGSIGDHVLWWDLMTRGAPGDDLYEVRAFHDRWGPSGPPEDHPHAKRAATLGRACDDLSSQAAAALAQDMLAQSEADAQDDWGLDAS